MNRGFLLFYQDRLVYSMEAGSQIGQIPAADTIRIAQEEHRAMASATVALLSCSVPYRMQKCNRRQQAQLRWDRPKRDDRIPAIPRNPPPPLRGADFRPHPRRSNGLSAKDWPDMMTKFHKQPWRNQTR